MKNSIKYLLKQALPLMIVLSVIFISIYDISCVFTKCHYEPNGFDYAIYLRYPDPNTYEIVIILALACAIIPILNFARYKNKNAVDVYFSLPLTNNELYIQKLIVGFIEIIIPFTLSYFIGFFIFIIRGSNFYIIQYLPMYLLLLVAALFMYIICSFFVIKANNVVDSILFIALFTVITTLINEGINYTYSLFTGKYNILDWRWSYLLAPYGLMYKVTDFYKYFLKTQMPDYSFSLQNVHITWIVICFVIQLVLAGLASFGIFKHIKNYKNEDTDEKSNTWFGYKTMVPILFTISLMLINANKNPVNYILLSVIFIVGYLVLTMAAEFRSVKIPKSRYITLVAIYVSYTIIYFGTQYLIPTNN